MTVRHTTLLRLLVTLSALTFRDVLHLNRLYAGAALQRVSTDFRLLGLAAFADAYRLKAVNPVAVSHGLWSGQFFSSASSCALSDINPDWAAVGNFQLSASLSSPALLDHVDVQTEWFSAASGKAVDVCLRTSSSMVKALRAERYWVIQHVTIARTRDCVAVGSRFTSANNNRHCIASCYKYK